MDTANKLAAGAALSIGLFGAINLLGSSVFSDARIDLTEERLYTLSEGAKEIARGLDEPIRLELYATQDMRKANPRTGDFMQRVEDVLENFVRVSDGKLKLERFDPVEFSEAEDEAALNGLQRIRMDGNAVGYFGLVMRNSVGDKETIAYFNPSDEIFLEYEIAQRLVSLDAADKPVLGLLTDLAVDGGPPMAPGQPAQPAWQILSLLERTFEVRRLESSTEAIEDDVDVLMLLHPNGLTDATLYAIDQFALDGGRVLALLDPSCLVDRDSQQGGALPASSDLGPLLEAWGVEFDASGLVADRTLAPLEPGSAGLLQVVATADQVDADDPVSARLSDLRFITVGALAATEGASTAFTPLVTTSDEAGQLAPSALRTADPSTLIEDFVPAYETYTLAARVSGPIATAFPKGPDGDDEAALPDGHLAESTADFEAILIADADMLFDTQWLQRSLFGVAKYAENPDLVLNAADQLAGSDALMSLRARGTFERPFEVVQELRLAAGEELAAEQARLQKELADIDTRIQEIAREQGGGGTVLLTPELEEELDKAYAKRDETRKELRRVQFNLKRDEEALGRRVKALNILGMPLVVIASGVLVWLRRRGRATA